MPRRTTTVNLQFDPCFDRVKLAELAPVLPATYGVLNHMAPWMRGKWPTKIKCMSHKKIIAGRRRGAGHGYVYPGGDSIWINPDMSVPGHWLVLVHENCHCAWPDMTEDEINCRMLGEIYKTVFRKRLDPEWARRQGIGAPAPGLNDRSYCR